MTVGICCCYIWKNIAIAGMLALSASVAFAGVELSASEGFQFGSLTYRARLLLENGGSDVLGIEFTARNDSSSDVLPLRFFPGHTWFLVFIEDESEIQLPTKVPGRKVEKYNRQDALVRRLRPGQQVVTFVPIYHFWLFRVLNGWKRDAVGVLRGGRGWRCGSGRSCDSLGRWT